MRFGVGVYQVLILSLVGRRGCVYTAVSDSMVRRRQSRLLWLLVFYVHDIDDSEIHRASDDARSQPYECKGEGKEGVSRRKLEHNQTLNELVHTHVTLACASPQP